MKIKRPVLLILTLTLALCQTTVAEPLVLAQTKVLKSTTLGETRNIYISLPRNFDTSGQTRYPVIYTLDGDSHLRMVAGTVDLLSNRARKMPPSIVVAIPNVDRFRDMTPTQDKPLSIPENVLNDSGYALLRRDQLTQAIEVFEYANQRYPHSPNTYDSLADAYESAGRLKEAKSKLEQGIKIATELNTNDLQRLQNHLNTLNAKLAKS